MKDDLKIKNLRSKISDLLFVFPRQIYFKQKKADGVLERSLRAMTPLGPRTSVAKSDYLIIGTELEFDVHIINNGKEELKDDIIAKLLEYGQYQGLGQFRNGGYGRFEIVSIK